MNKHNEHQHWAAFVLALGLLYAIVVYLARTSASAHDNTAGIWLAVVGISILLTARNLTNRIGRDDEE